MELELTRIWSLNHYSNPGATAGQMPKGRLVARCRGGERCGIGDRSHRRWLSPGPGIHPLHGDLSRSRLTSSSTQSPLTQALVGAGAAGGSRGRILTSAHRAGWGPRHGLDQPGRAMATGPLLSVPPAPGRDDLTAGKKLHQQQGGEKIKEKKKVLGL